MKGVGKPTGKGHADGLYLSPEERKRIKEKKLRENSVLQITKGPEGERIETWTTANAAANHIKISRKPGKVADTINSNLRETSNRFGIEPNARPFSGWKPK